MKFNPINKNNPLVLASASPRRKNLLEQINIPFMSLPSEIEENPIGDGPSLIVRTLAEKKAKAVTPGKENRWILGADTIVVLEDEILGKPSDTEDAMKMLKLLEGKQHEVITGFCILDPTGKTAHLDYSSTVVTMKKMTEDEIKSYIASGEPFGKAGSYAIQGVGAFMVEGISGSYTNVVGLPVCALIKALLQIEALECFPIQ